ncbi:hypothetical protein CTEN210_15262 [Chaetoceros tenuissimus]|uniref:Uncharacterized protein n=1 Tax=Chaetoceros tenuissimus TaxID=426638 RepID=A0AAD3HD30_9STRA|nr:hypothetical protein CTEN210_15262 [Chaetoceros tenuissimus]
MEDLVNTAVQQLQENHFSETRLSLSGCDSTVDSIWPSLQTSGQDLSTFLDCLHSRIHDLEESSRILLLSRLRRIMEISILHHDTMRTLPTRALANLCPNIRCFRIERCKVLSNIQSLFLEFGNIWMLQLHDCPQITSLDFITNCPLNHMHISHLSIRNCGLVSALEQKKIDYNSERSSKRQRRESKTNDPSYTQDIWTRAFSVLSQTTSNHVELSITKCENMFSIPSSIRLLASKITLLHLTNLINLTHLTSEIGSMQQLEVFLLLDTAIKHLPMEIGRLGINCLVQVSGKELISPPKCFLGSMHALRKYFTKKKFRIWRGFIRLSILLRYARNRAIERLYKPGGKGYIKCRESFESKASEHS